MRQADAIINYLQARKAHFLRMEDDSAKIYTDEIDRILGWIGQPEPRSQQPASTMTIREVMLAHAIEGCSSDPGLTSDDTVRAAFKIADAACSRLDEEGSR